MKAKQGEWELSRRHDSDFSMQLACRGNGAAPSIAKIQRGDLEKVMFRYLSKQPILMAFVLRFVHDVGAGKYFSLVKKNC